MDADLLSRPMRREAVVRYATAAEDPDNHIGSFYLGGNTTIWCRVCRGVDDLTLDGAGFIHRICGAKESHR